jgi:hypothetical protein
MATVLTGRALALSVVAAIAVWGGRCRCFQLAGEHF